MKRSIIDLPPKKASLKNIENLMKMTETAIVANCINGGRGQGENNTHRTVFCLDHSPVRVIEPVFSESDSAEGTEFSFSGSTDKRQHKRLLRQQIAWAPELNRSRKTKPSPKNINQSRFCTLQNSFLREFFTNTFSREKTKLIATETH